jgi:hypothetical protein
MKFSRWSAFIILISAILLFAPNSFTPAQNAEGELEENFKNPPDSAKPHAWWHWMNGNVTKEGITADLEWMRRAGLAGMQLVDADLGTPQFVEQRLVWMTPPWKDAFRHAVNESQRLGLEMDMEAAGGWSETGGPWVKPEAGMKKIVWTETSARGPARFLGVLPHPPINNGRFQSMGMPMELANPAPKDIPGEVPQFPPPPPPPDPTFYADTRVIAYRLPADEVKMADMRPTITTSEEDADTSVLTDGNYLTELALHVKPKESTVWVQFEFLQPYRAEAFLLGGGNVNVFSGGAILDGELQSSDDGKTWNSVTSLSAPYFVNRDFPIQTYSFAPTTAKFFRAVLRPAPPDSGVMDLAKAVGVHPPDVGVVRLAEVELSGARVNHWQGKAAFGDTSDFSSIATPAVSASQAVSPQNVIDITSHMNSQGILNWNVPSGRWVILRMGYSLTGKKNHPATREATGYEVDKLSAKYVGDYFKTYVEMVSDAAGPNFGKSFRNFLMDSWEAGVENWTDDMIEEFTRRRGYDPTPFLPVLTGRIVGSSEASDQFLWDFRRTIADLLADNHYKLATDYLKQFGIGLYAQAEGPFSPTTADSILNKGQVTYPMAEFWVPKPGHKDTYYHCTDLWEAASTAHVYGKPIASAESFTTGATAPIFASPYYLKPLGDRAMSYGINRFVLSSADHQPFVDQRHRPGMTLGYSGQNFPRTNTWAEQMVAFDTYLARSSYLLQQGKFVGDLAYFYGEQIPGTIYFWKPLNPALPDGYKADWMNSDVILNRLSVANGRFILPDGMSYKVLVIPDYVKRITLPVLRKLRDLVEAGGVVIAPKLAGSPSLADAGHEAEYQSIVVQLWGNMDGSASNEHAVGNGKVYWGKPIEDVLRAEQTPPDFEHNDPAIDTDLVWIHRRDGDRDFYFVANQNDRAEDIDASFRVEGREAELWHPDTGKIEPASYRMDDGRTMVPLHLDPCGSIFVVFQHPTNDRARALPQAVTSSLAKVEGPWEIDFPAHWGAPPKFTLEKLTSWTDVPNDGVKYFSGTATYKKDVNVPQEWLSSGAKILLDLGAVREIAEVSLNGKAVGGILWKPPYRADIAAALQPGVNHLEVKITNLWPNRLIGDQQPDAHQYAWIDYRPFKASSPLQPSGLIGPVEILQETTK